MHSCDRCMEDLRISVLCFCYFDSHSGCRQDWLALLLFGSGHVGKARALACSAAALNLQHLSLPSMYIFISDRHCLAAKQLALQQPRR